MPVEFKITLNDEGGLAVSGPIDNKILAIGALELAKDAVLKFHTEQADKRVQLVPASAIPRTKVE